MLSENEKRAERLDGFQVPDDPAEDEEIEIIPVNECGVVEDSEEQQECEVEKLRREMDEARDEYLRLYAEFDNYKKRVARDREELVKYSNENILHELLPTIDNLDIALKHADEESAAPLLKGVNMTLRELYRTLEKFGVKAIEAVGVPFNPEVHHAMAHLDRDDMPEGMVVAEFRKGFTIHDKLLRPSLVSVSKRPAAKTNTNKTEEGKED